MQRLRANGKRIANLRDDLDLTQEELSVKVGYSVKTIWKAESGGVLRRRTLEHFAIALNSTLEEIAYFSDRGRGAIGDGHRSGMASEVSHQDLAGH